jgi:type VI secretion system protein ImpE
MHPPEKPLDLLWRQATVSIESGPDGDVYLPTIYLDLAGKLPEDSSLRLGRSTDWVDVGHSIVRGQGQKTLLVGEKDLPIMELQSIEREQ